MKFKLPGSFRVIGRSVVDWWDSWLDLVGAVILWFLAQITIVLGPPATFGLYYTIHALINGESQGGRGVIEGGRKYFGVSWLWMLLNVVVITLTISNIWFYGQFTSIWAFYAQLFFVFLGLTWIMVQFYALAFFMEMKEKKLLTAMRNGFFTGMASPVFSILVILFGMVVAILSVVFVLPVFFGLPAIVPILAVRAMYNRLETYGLREKEKSPKELEREHSGRIQVPKLNEVSDGERHVEEDH